MEKGKESTRNKEQDTEEVMVHQLPAKIWASILSDYCSYSDLRNCLSVCTSFRYDIPPHIKCLYILKPRELDLRYARKFPLVERVYICSLMWISSTEDKDRVVLCLDSARNAVAFLECFPKLSFTHVGGYTPNKPQTQKVSLDDRMHCDLPYLNYLCKKPANHQNAFRGMLHNFCNAFESGALDVNRLQVSGLFSDAKFIMYQLDCNDQNRCQLCPWICQTFRPDSILELRGGVFCVPDQERYRYLYRRDRDLLRGSNALPALLKKHNLISIRLQSKVLQGNMVLIGEKLAMKLNYEESTLENMQFLCSDCDCDASMFSPEDNFKCLNFLNKEHNQVMRDVTGEDSPPHITRELFDRLTQIGFRLSESDLVIVSADETRDGPFPGVQYYVVEGNDGTDESSTRVARRRI